MIRITLKSLLGHKLRFALTAVAVTLGVAFVVGSFVLTESVRAQFQTLFSDVSAGVDLQVRGEQAFEVPSFGGADGRPPVPEDLLETIAALPEVSQAAGTVGGIGVDLLDDDGELLATAGQFTLGLNWSDAPELAAVDIIEGTAPTADDEILLDVDTMGDELAVGQQLTLNTPVEQAVPYTIVGVFRFGDENALAGASLVGFTTAEAQRIFNYQDAFQTIEVALADGTSVEEGMGAVEAVLPEGVEVVDQQTMVEDQQSGLNQFIDIFQNTLLGFAFITLFVSAFLIFNTFRIVIGQRVRELALLRAVGASTGQVFGSVMGEALFIGLLSSLLGFGFGILVALGFLAIINASGFGTGNTELAVTLEPFVWALGLGIGVTVLSAVLPALQSTRVPPVAAMRDGFSLDEGKLRTRVVVGSVITVVGALLLFLGLNGDSGTVILTGMALGSVLVFLGVAALCPVVAGPITRVLGAPLRATRITGRLATENAARSPARTASTASALMIGLALVTMALVVGNSVKASFLRMIDTGITADWYIGSDQMDPFSDRVADQLRALPELDAVSAAAFAPFQVDGSTKQATAIDFDTVTRMFDLELVAGSVGDGSRGLLLHRDPADDLGVEPGDLVDVVFNETGATRLEVVGIYGQSGVVGNWLLDIETFRENFSNHQVAFATATTAPGVDPEAARAAITSVLEPLPRIEVWDREEYKDDLESDLNVALIVINVFLLLAVVIAGFGIANTLALSVFERTRELGLLRAIGETNNQVRTMITFEAVIIALFGAVLGIAVGLAFGLATATALPEDFVSIIEVPAGSLVVVLVLAVVLGVIASIFPAWRASRMNVLEAISYE